MSVQRLERQAMTFVLVHGGGSTGRFWDRVVPLLDQPVLAVDLPGRGDKPADLATLGVDVEVASVLADIAALDVDSDITLVAHSSGGLVVPGVVAGSAGRVTRIVLNAALVPREGGCGLDCMQPRHREGLRLAVEQARLDGRDITLPGPPPDPDTFRGAYGGDPLSDADLAFLVDPVRCVPDTVHHYFQPIHWLQAAGVPVTYILNELDRPVPPAAQEEMITHLPGPTTVVRIASGHVPAVTDPERLAGLLIR
jgi:pimeloyl-ACP methyl ester carboxylesterase